MRSRLQLLQMGTIPHFCGKTSVRRFAALGYFSPDNSKRARGLLEKVWRWRHNEPPWVAFPDLEQRCVDLSRGRRRFSAQRIHRVIARAELSASPVLSSSRCTKKIARCALRRHSSDPVRGNPPPNTMPAASGST